MVTGETAIDVREATGDEAAAWAQRFADRRRAWFRRFEVSPEWVENRLRRETPTADALSTYALVDRSGSGKPVGNIALSIQSSGGRAAGALVDLFVERDHRQRGVARAAVAWAVDHVRRRAEGPATLWVSLEPSDPASSALFKAWPVRAQNMIKRVMEPETLPPGVDGRRMTQAEYDVWLDRSIRGYADDKINSGSTPPDEALAESVRETQAMLPDGLHTPGHTFWVVTAPAEVGGTPVPVATNWLQHQYAPNVSWVYGVETYAAHRGHGYGRAAMIVGEHATLAAGDTHLGLNVFGHNHVAINLYTSMGYAVVDQYRSLDIRKA